MRYLKLYEGFFMHFGRRKFKADKSLSKKRVPKKVQITNKDIEDAKYTFAEINDIGITMLVQKTDTSLVIVLSNKTRDDLRKRIESDYVKFNSDVFIEILKFALPYSEENFGLTIENIIVRYAHVENTHIIGSAIEIKSLDEYIKRVKNIQYIYKVVIVLHKIGKYEEERDSW